MRRRRGAKVREIGCWGWSLPRAYPAHYVVVRLGLVRAPCMLRKGQGCLLEADLTVRGGFDAFQHLQHCFLILFQRLDSRSQTRQHIQY